MPTEITTVCFHTRDAVESTDGAFTFEMPADRLREDAVKVALASCEFPMVQWTIEEEWSRLWMNEGIRLNEATNFLDVVMRTPGGPEPDVPWRLWLPPRWNRVKRAKRCEGRLVVECEAEHGLASRPRDVLRLVGASTGDVVATAKSIAVATEHAFTVQLADVGASGGTCAFTHLLAPTIKSPKHLCTMLTAAARDALGEGLKMAFRYDAASDRIVASGVVPITGAVVRVLPTPLARMCGLSTHPVHFERHAHTWPSEDTQFWDYVEMPPGFYGPCHRPMCVGQPLRFGPELESAVNRFYFPLGGGAPGADGRHLLVFADPNGHVLTCAIPPGRYSPRTLAVHLEDRMTEAARAFQAGVTFSVFHNDKHRFVFSCERSVGGTYRGATFSLLFNHPLCIDAHRLGFDPQPVTGSSTYVATRATRPAHVEPGGSPRTVANILRVSEIVSQKRFRIHAAPPPSMVGVVGGKPTERGRVRVTTLVNKQPFAHGFQDGDAVRLVSHPAHKAVVRDEHEQDVHATSAVLPDDCTCIVRDAGGGTTDPCVLELEVPRLDGLADENTCIQIVSDVEPINLHFGKPHTLPSHLVGFRPGGVLWGADGTLENEDGERVPPFEAPFSHCLDHPDYVLMTFSESSAATFEHSYDGESKSVFCKLSLYPLFREERMLPRDTTLLRNNLSRFTLSFWNPDMRTPYKFHGARFSFSLNFISVVPG